VINLKYKLIGDNDYIFDPIGTVLRNRGIENVDQYLNLDESVCISYKNLKNIHKAVSCLIKHINQKSDIFIMVDSDADGYTSASIIYQYIKLIDPEINIIWEVHKGKEHGISKIDIPSHVKLVIVPDAGSNDFDKHKELHERGIDVIVLDHHEVERESEHAIVVNSQLGGYQNLNLSGAGIVYKFCKALDDELWEDYADNFLDLVALGNISDSMSMKELETRYLVSKGLENINNEFFMALLKQQEFSVKGKASITNVMFYITPLINATIRFGTMDDKRDMFKAFIGEKSLVKYKPRNSEEIYEPFVVNMARRCFNLRGKQSRENTKIFKILDEQIQQEQLDKYQVIIIDANKHLKDSNLSGLIANQIATKYKKPAIVFSSIENNILSGSARGYDKSELKDFKQVVLETNLFEYALGHSNAYGIGIRKERLQEALKELNLKLKNYSFEDIFEVDFHIPSNSLGGDLINLIYNHGYLWGKDVEEPLLLIEMIPINIDNVSLIGKKEDTIKVWHSGVTYMFFKEGKEQYSEFVSGKYTYLNVIGRANVNEYEGNVYPQVIVDEFELIK
jgi:single-stranded-DNA-specific exonuclease